MRKKKRKYKRKSIVQRHHLCYDPDIGTRMYAEEHFYLTKIDRFTYPISRGFLTALEFFVLRHVNRAVDLDKEYRKKEKKELAKLKEMYK